MTVMMLTSLLGGAGYSTVLAAAKAYALWCEGNKTVYYVYGETAYAAGGTYDGQTITQVFENKIAYWVEDYGGYYDWDDDITGSVQKVVLTDGYCASKQTDLGWLFAGMTKLTTITGLGNLNTSEATTLEGMFYCCSSLTSIDVSTFNTSKATNMAHLFSDDLELQEIKGLDHFDTSNVTNMQSMFSGCKKMTSIDVSHFNTSKVLNMGLMFNYCLQLQSLDLSHFDTSNVTDFHAMFYSCPFTSIDVSRFDTSKAETMVSMFGSCYMLESLDVTNFNTEKVVEMDQLFKGCSKLTTLDLRNFNTTNVTSMIRMFNNCSELTTIYCNDSWSASQSTEMFKGCTKLVGAIPYSFTKITVEYANPTTGYFTGRKDPSMSFSPSNVIATYGESFTPPTLTKPNGITVEYSSDNPKVATVDATTGEVTLLHSGSANITASFAGDDDYNAASASYQLLVNAKNLGLSIGGVVMNSDHLVDNTELTAALNGVLTAGTVTLTSGTDFNDLTLTLNDAKIQTATNTALGNYSSLTLVLKGSNEMTSTYSAAAGLTNVVNHVITITGSGQLKVTGYAIGTNNRGTFILNGPTLETCGRAISYYGEEASTLKIQGGTLIASAAERATIESLGSLELGTGVVITQPAGAVWNSSQHAICDAEGNVIKTQITISGNAVANDLAFASATASAKMGADFTAPVLSNPHNLAVSYTSSKTDVATVDANGKVTLVKPGETVITASFAGNADYLAGSASYTLTVAKGDPSISYSEATASVVFGAELSAPTLTVTPESLKNNITITSSNTAVAKITGLGDVTVVGAGETTIKAAFAGDDYYNAAEASYKLTVTAAAATLTFAQTDCSTTVGASFNSPELSTTPASLKVKYSSSDPDLATVSEETGVVVAKAEGVVTITATSADVSYTGSASYKLTITRSASGLQFASATATATYGADFTAPELKNEHSLSVRYESSNTAVATVEEFTGKVILLKAGETTITARFAGNDEYEPASASYVLTVKKAKATLTFAQTECTGVVREDFTPPTLTVNPAGLEVRYSSNDTDVAGVNDENGFVVLYAEGEVIITATVVSEQYEGEAFYKITVVAPAVDGDANGDGEIDVADIDFVIEHIGEDLNDNNKAADVNADDAINVADVDYIIERIK